MIVFLLTLVRVDRGQSKFVIPRERIIRNAFPFVIPCAAASRPDSPIGLLPMIYCKEGQYEKNTYQRDSGRGVADGDGRRTAPLRPKHRVTRQ